MLTLAASSRIFLFKEAMDMRKSFDGLTAAVAQAFPGQMGNISYFLFLNRRKDSLKVLYWDVDGFAIWYKRLEKGTFSAKTLGETLSRREFLMLLEGIEPKRIKPRYTYF